MLAVKMTLDNPAYITEAEYLEGEKIAEVRHEYVDGVVYAMAGTTRRHNDIAVNITSLLRPLTRGTPCKVNAADVKVRAEKVKSYYYPDVIVSCVQDDADEYYLEKPCLIVEVTSKSTEWKDFTEKALAYQKLASLQVYLIVAQDQPQVTLFYRDEEGAWDVARFDNLDQSFPLPCPETSLSLADIYEGIGFTQVPAADS